MRPSGLTSHTFVVPESIWCVCLPPPPLDTWVSVRTSMLDNTGFVEDDLARAIPTRRRGGILRPSSYCFWTIITDSCPLGGRPIQSVDLSRLISP